jgi:3-hydroxyisobutyrate dehydrogenase-like beta-hydroxyacid dehydrogenase
MSQRVSVIGLGRMGSALATTLLEDHYKVTVWNRTTAKAEPLVEAGATLAASVIEAIDGSEIVIVCLGDYDATNQIFSGCADLTGKTLIQLTWGTAAEAEAMQDWAESKKALYLDGLIIAYPSQIGNDETLLIVGGSKEAWRSGERPIMCLGGSSKYVGTNLGAMIVLEEALVVPLLMATMGTIYGAQILEQAGLDIGLYADMLSVVTPILAKSLPREVTTIAANDFTNTEASIETWGVDGYDHTEELPTGAIDLLEPIRELLNQAVAAGYGDEGIAAAIKVLRRTNQPT